MSGYPTGCTMAELDRAQGNVTALDIARANARQQEREEEADELMRRQDVRFVEWLQECNDFPEWAPALVAALNGSRDDVQAAVAIAEQLADDWKQYWVASDDA